MMPKDATTEAAILEKVVAPFVPDLSPEAARGLLSFKFDHNTVRQIRSLLQKNNRGTITTEDRLTLENYLRVGQFLDLVHAKARLSLQKNGSSS
jgi:hypothetical protein